MLQELLGLINAEETVDQVQRMKGFGAKAKKQKLAVFICFASNAKWEMKRLIDQIWRYCLNLSISHLAMPLLPLSAPRQHSFTHRKLSAVHQRSSAHQRFPHYPGEARGSSRRGQPYRRALIYLIFCRPKRSAEMRFVMPTHHLEGRQKSLQPPDRSAF